MLNSIPRSRRRIQHALGALVVLLALVVAPIAAPTTAHADDAPSPGDVGVATRPAGPDGTPDDRTRFSYTADPGQSVTDQVYVGNTGTERQDFTVLATDAFNGADGAFNLLATADSPTGIGSWVTFENGQNRIQFSLDPQEVRLLTFTVAFPADATPGDHVGGIAASVLQEGETVKVDRRVATAIFARVSGDLQPRLTLASYEATYQGDWWNPFGGTLKILYTVDNPGNVALASNNTTHVATWFGIPATGDAGGSTPILLPGSSATYEVDIPGVAQWGYLSPSMSMQPFVDTTDASQVLSVTPVTRDTVVIAIPWALLILAALIAGVVWFVRARRRRDEARAAEWIAYTQAEAAAAAEQKLRVDAGSATDS
ncbi:MAG: hypothetical protein J0I43_10990 [Microbacterium sp.]|uniref:hypothetical protein n=1 Tax=Microbacterium sp. TaxID=51671 RepID=UPI001AD2AB46|nr:hypothetical protein [Microbacterium sp.]MBN9177880.1 hypothetical protein [Microbacterium sp.]